MRQLFLGKTKFLEKHTFDQSRLLGKIYLKAYQAIVLREIELAKIGPKTKVLHIGGGIPYTATIIVASTGAEVTVLEIDAEVMQTANEWLKKYNCGDKIKTILADGANFSAVDFDVIILSLNIAPKEAILVNIFNTSQAGTRIIYRSAKNVLSAIYGDVEPLDKYKSFIRKKAQHWGFTLKASLLLVKEEEGGESIL
ncbi:hypothetical protein LR003_02970 [candidate division NPL-UPA2 bacterium]|nr:hypothetical protein [candidate division NPL-UPA2 bacterium]